MAKEIYKNYTFDPINKTIQFNSLVSIGIEDILIITNLESNTLIYNFAITGMGGSVSGNILTLDFDTSSMSPTDKLQIFINTKYEKTVLYSNSLGRELLSDSVGRLAVTSMVEPAPDTTQVKITLKNQVTGPGESVYTYTIPNGENLHLIKLSAGAEDGSRSSKVELFYAPSGILNGSEIGIETLYLSGNNYFVDLIDEFTGNGTAAIIIRRVRFDGGDREIFCKLIGYY